MDDQLKKALALLEKRGYIAKIRKPTTKKTLEIADDHLAAFEAIVHKRDVRIKDAVAEMFEMWIEKWKG